MPTEKIDTMWYHFSQNNSGGSFDDDDDVCENVIIQATDARHANQRAEDIGIYFNGCSNGMDCSCCGDRWSEQWDDDDGEEFPHVYGTPVEEVRRGGFRSRAIVYPLIEDKKIIIFPEKED